MILEFVTIGLIMSCCCKVLSFMVLLIILLIVGVVCAYYLGFLSPETKEKLSNTVKNYTQNVHSKREICDQPNSFLISLIMIFFTLFVVLFVMGIMKGIIGLLCSHKVGMFGLDVILDLPHPITCYFEPELRHCKVVYDSEGWPVHPQCPSKRVKIMSNSAQFCLNASFYFTFPCIVLWVAFQSLCGRYDVSYQKSFNEIPSKMKCNSCDNRRNRESECKLIGNTCPVECVVEKNSQYSITENRTKNSLNQPLVLRIRSSINTFKDTILQNPLITNLKKTFKSEACVPIIEVSNQESCVQIVKPPDCLDNITQCSCQTNKSVCRKSQTECKLCSTGSQCQPPCVVKTSMHKNQEPSLKCQPSSCKSKLSYCECKPSCKRQLPDSTGRKSRKSYNWFGKKKNKSCQKCKNTCQSPDRICQPQPVNNYGTLCRNSNSKPDSNKHMIHNSNICTPNTCHSLNICETTNTCQSPNTYRSPNSRSPNTCQTTNTCQSPNIGQSPIGRSPNMCQSPNPHVCRTSDQRFQSPSPNTYQSPSPNTYRSPTPNTCQTSDARFHSTRNNSKTPSPYQTPTHQFQLPNNEPPNGCPSPQSPNNRLSPNNCGPSPNNCGPSPNNCGPSPNNCGPSPNNCGTSPNKNTEFLSPVGNSYRMPNYNNAMPSTAQRDSIYIDSKEMCNMAKTNKIESIFGKSLCDPVIPHESSYTVSPISLNQVSYLSYMKFTAYDSTSSNCDSVTELLFFDPTLKERKKPGRKQPKQRGGAEIPISQSDSKIKNENDLIDQLDIYDENGSEEEDTKYVLDQLCISEYSLKRMAESERH